MLNSLYFRLIVTSIAVLVVFLATLGIVIDNAFSESARSGLRERMLGQVYQLLTASTLDESGRLKMPLPADLPDSRLALPNSGLYAFVANNNSEQLIWRSPSLQHLPTPKPLRLEIGEKRWLEFKSRDGVDYCLLGFGYQRASKTGIYSYNFYLMSELNPTYQQIKLYRRKLWGGLTIALALILGIQTLALRWGLKPLRAVGQELGNIERGDSRKIKGYYPNEIKNLTNKINNLLEQERARQTRYRNALADLSHSLKTPLAVLLGGIDQPETLAETVEEQTVRMIRIVDRQLQRAGTATDPSSHPVVNIFPVSERIVTSLSKVYRNKPVTVSNLIAPDFRFRCDEADMVEIFGNLLDNAFKWCKGQILIHAEKEGRRIIINIEDDGPGIHSNHIQHILQRGGRLDETTPGHGIGLSLVSDIVEAYFGSLRIEKSRLGGAWVSVEFTV